MRRFVRVAAVCVMCVAAGRSEGMNLGLRMAMWNPPPAALALPEITPADGATFSTDSCTVTITCATAGASVYYTTDGATPRPSKRFLYTGPFTITDSAEICAFAVLGDKTSDYVTAIITKVEPVVLTLADAIDVPERTVTTGGDTGWEPVEEETAVGGSSARSGAIVQEETSWMEMSVSGAGTLTFSWKADCEKDPRNRYSYDFGAFCLDGAVASRIDGATAWQMVTVEIAESGAHTLRWAYTKDDYDEDDFEGEDCIWVDNVVWTPSGGPDAVVDIGGGKSVSIPQTWLTENTARAATDAAANGRKVWECYVLGLDPEDNSETNDFKIVSFPMKADGTPDLDNLGFYPPQKNWNLPGAQPVLKGRANLGSGDWQTVTDKNKASFKFFRVEVDIP